MSCVLNPQIKNTKHQMSKNMNLYINATWDKKNDNNNTHFNMLISNLFPLWYNIALMI